MQPVRTSHLYSTMFVTSVLGLLLFILVGCTQTSLATNSVSAPATAKAVNVDAPATHAAQTIEAALHATMTATTAATPTPPPTLALASKDDHSEATATSTLQIVSAIPVVVVGVLKELGQESPTATPLPTATPNLDATATSEERRLADAVAIALAATQTAQPTITPTPTPTPLPTATPNLAATATADMQRLAAAVAATLTAQPSATPTATDTATPTATPNLAATATTEAERLATAVAATLTAQPTATPTVTATATPAPTATPTPDFALFIANYRQAERAALQTLDPNVLDQLPIFATGEALDALKQQVETLRAANQYQLLIVENMHIDQVLLGANPGVLTTEQHNIQTFARAADNDRLLEHKVVQLQIVYGFVFQDERWKVEKVRIVATK